MMKKRSTLLSYVFTAEAVGQVPVLEQMFLGREDEELGPIVVTREAVLEQGCQT